MPRNEVDVPSVKPMTVASSSRTVGERAGAAATTGAKYSVQAKSDAIPFNMMTTFVWYFEVCHNNSHLQYDTDVSFRHEGAR